MKSFLLLFASLGLLIGNVAAPCLAQDVAQVGSEATPAHAAYSTKGMVASVHPLATNAGVRVLEEGGNAIDAAVAVALTLGVVDSHNSGIGGGCFILIRRANGEVLAIDGREMAPGLAHDSLYIVDDKPRPDLSQTGPLAVGTPGALMGYNEALKKAGTRTLADLINPAADLADDGFIVTRGFASVLRSKASDLRKFEGSKQALLKPDGSAYSAGERMKQPDLANTYRSIASEGIDWFYQGPFAERVGAWMKDNGGILSADDFEAYRVVFREPIRSTYRGYEIIGFPPPSSGGVHVAQMLNMLEQFDLPDLYRDDPVTFVHLVSESMKLAFADRAFWLGDSDYVDVPRGLVDPEYARELAKRIDREKTIKVESHGHPPSLDDPFFGKHTTNLSVVDSQGNWVSITQTVNTSFGSKVVVPGTGVVLNNEMDDFAIAPGVRNAFGLVGSDANSVQAGKRPLSSMSPTIVLKGGEPILTVGAAGGPKIITQVLLTIIRHLDGGETLPDAVAAPRFHHQWSPDRLIVESSAPEEWTKALVAMGHRVNRSGTVGVTQAIGYSEDGKTFVGVHDPRVEGKAAGPR